MKTEDNLHQFLQEQDRHLLDIDMSGSLYLEFKETFKTNRNENTL